MPGPSRRPQSHLAKGGFMTTASGGAIYPLSPDPKDVSVYDIAYALGNVCRFGGHCRSFYSVAQHSVLVAANVPRDLRYAALLHDAAEAYIGDLVRPAKQGASSYRAIEHRLMLVICDALRCPIWTLDHAEIRAADVRALMTERRDLIHNPNGWTWDELEDVQPFADPIRPMQPAEASGAWASAFVEYCPDPEVRAHGEQVLAYLSPPG